MVLQLELDIARSFMQANVKRELAGARELIACRNYDNASQAIDDARKEFRCYLGSSIYREHFPLIEGHAKDNEISKEINEVEDELIESRTKKCAEDALNRKLSELSKRLDELDTRRTQ